MSPTMPNVGVGDSAASEDVADVHVVVGVGSLEPGAAVVEIEVNGIDGSEAEVDAVEEVFFVALVVEDGELGWIKEAAGVDAIQFEEVAPVLAAIGEIEAAGCGAEGAVGGVEAAGGLGDSLTGAGGGDDDEAGFVAILGGGRAGDDFERLDGVGRESGWRRLLLCWSVMA